MLIFSTLVCAFLIGSLLKNVQHNPIVSYQSIAPVEVSSIPFPAVTYCPDNKTLQGDFAYEATTEALKSGNITIDDISEDK